VNRLKARRIAVTTIGAHDVKTHLVSADDDADPMLVQDLETPRSARGW